MRLCYRIWSASSREVALWRAVCVCVVLTYEYLSRLFCRPTYRAYYTLHSLQSLSLSARNLSPSCRAVLPLDRSHRCLLTISLALISHLAHHLSHRIHPIPAPGNATAHRAAVAAPGGPNPSSTRRRCPMRTRPPCPCCPQQQARRWARRRLRWRIRRRLRRRLRQQTRRRGAPPPSSARARRWPRAASA